MGIDAGSRVLHYVLVRRLGAGGMGEVFLADDTRLDRRVAIKFLIGDADEHARKRILQEARSAAALDHPNICAIYEAGSDPEVGDFIVMQYVEGETLAAMLTRGPLVPARALEIVERIASALVAAHARGIVHRDLKPQNVIVTPAGDVKLLDFGVAKRIADGPANAEARTSSALTYPGAVVGTPAYMSPEQIRSEPADVRSDLFALGCVLYECLTGRRAFWGATSQDVFAQILQAHPAPPSEFSGAVTAQHDAICARLMQKSPTDRFQTAADALAAIRAITGGTATKTQPPGPAPRTSRFVIGAAIVAAVVIAALVWWPRGLPTPPRDAVDWYTRGVEAIRDGRYVAAKSMLQEAVHRFDRYVQAYSRLAEAHAELDEESDAKSALVRVSQIADVDRAPSEDQLRIAAVSAFVLRDYKTSIQKYTALAEAQPKDAGRWLDVGRAEEAAGQRAPAVAHYERAVTLDDNYAAAHLRLGTLRARGGKLEDGLASLRRAEDIYSKRQEPEGVMEALLRRGLVLTPVGRFDDAREALTKVVEMAASPSYVNQRVRASFDLGRGAAVSGRFDDGVAIIRKAIADAKDAGLWGYAAIGQIDLANVLLVARREGEADAELSRAIEIASQHGAKMTGLRAQLQQASLKLTLQKPEEAIALLDEPLKLLRDPILVRYEADAKNILSRAYEDLEQYDRATTIAREVLTFAESTGDQLQVATALDNIATQLTKQGQLPEALALRERREQIDRTLKNHASLAYDLTVRAELLIRLGRGRDADSLFNELDSRVAEKNQAYLGRQARMSALRAMRAAIDLKPADALRFAELSETIAGKQDPTSAAGVLADYGRAAAGRPRREAPRPPNVSTPQARELRYWEALAWLARKDYAKAFEVAKAAHAAPGAANNAELRWRLAAVAANAAKYLKNAPPDGATMRARAEADLQQLRAQWSTAAAAYLTRPDLVALRQRLS